MSEAKTGTRRTRQEKIDALEARLQRLKGQERSAARKRRTGHLIALGLLAEAMLKDGNLTGGGEGETFGACWLKTFESGAPRYFGKDTRIRTRLAEAFADIRQKGQA